MQSVRDAGGPAREFLDRLYKFNPEAKGISDNWDSIISGARDAFSRLWQTIQPIAQEAEGLGAEAVEVYESSGLPPL